MRIPALPVVVLAALMTCAAAAAPARAQPGGRPWSLGVPRPEVGCEFPDFPLPDPAGAMVWFNDYRGKVLLVAFCSCYTDTCCPILNALADLRREHGAALAVVLVCCETAPALEKGGYEGLVSMCRDAADRVLIDEGWRTKDPFHVQELPTTYLIDGDFCLRHRASSVAELNAEPFRAALARAIADAARKP